MRIDPSIATRYTVENSSDPGKRYYIDHGLDQRWDVTRFVACDGEEYLEYGKRDPLGGYVTVWYHIIGERS
jgi:hypothetical protein